MDYGEAIAFFEAEGPYLLTTHVNADGDGIGATMALGGLLEQLDRPYRIILGDEHVDRKLSFLPQSHRIENIKLLTDRPLFDRAVYLDTPTVSQRRVGDVALLLNEEAKILVIDHHKALEGEGNVRLVDAGASAASELVFRLIQASKAEITPEIANQLYAGIAFDTKLFKYSHPVRGIKACAELVDFGADPQRVSDELFAHESYETVKTLGVGLSTLELHFAGCVASLSVDYETYCLDGDLDVVVDHAMSIDGVEAALFLKEEASGRHRVSLRSRGELDVNAVAAVFGGGGHERASGCTIEGLLEEVKQKLLKEVERIL